MKNNYPHDPLEEYFRQTLGEHEALPPEDLWERMEPSLPPPAAVPWWMPYRAMLVLGSLALLLLFALFLPGSALHRCPLPTPLSSLIPLATRSVGEHQAPTSSPLPNVTQHSPNHRREKPSLSPREAAQQPRSAAQESEYLHTQHLKFKQQHAKANTAEDLAAQTTVNTSDEPSNPPAPTRSYTGPTPTSSASAATATPLPLFHLHAPLRPVAPSKPSLPPVLPATVPPLWAGQSLSGWSLGLYGAVILPPEASSLPARGGGPRPLAFVRQPQPRHLLGEGSLRVGKQLSTRWSIETGLAYSKQQHTTIYLSRFRFGDGRPSPGGGGPQPSRREYAHYLNTPAGSATVDFRMEPTTSADPVGSEEIVRVRAEATEAFEVLKVPLLVSYSIVKSGRLTGTARAGVVAEVFLRNDWQLSAFVSENARVRLTPGFKPAVQWTPARNGSIGYWLSVGVAYRCHRHILFSVEPTLTGRFAHKDATGRPLPNPAMLGLQAGMLYLW